MTDWSKNSDAYGATGGGTYDTNKKIGSVIGGVAGLATGSTWATIGTTLLSFGLSALTQPKQKREWTGQDALLYDLKKRYTAIRERKEAAINIASSITGRPRESFMGMTGFNAIRQPIKNGQSAIGIYDTEKKDKKEKKIEQETLRNAGVPASTG